MSTDHSDQVKLKFNAKIMFQLIPFMNNYFDQFDCENYENYFYEILSQLEMEICFR